MSQVKVRFGPFEIDIRAGELHKGSRRLRLQEKPLKVLQALIEQPGQIVTREELRTRLWPANMFVDFDNGLNNAINKLRVALGDSAEAPKYVETVGRRGYRFIGQLEESSEAPIATEKSLAAKHASRKTGLPISPISESDARARAVPEVVPLPIAVDAQATRIAVEPTRASTAPAPIRATRHVAVALAALLAVGITAWFMLRPETISSGAPRIRSLAVLPLDNLSNDPEQEYFSDGMTDALISQLAGIRSLRVISRQSVMRYKRSDMPMRAIALELNVDGVIEGTVLREDNRVRISVQLIHAPTDQHLWSDRYERPLDDVMALQAEIARHVADKVQAAVTAKETARLAQTEPIDAEAYDLYLRGRHFWAQRTEESLHRALDYFRRALAIEPEFALAHAAIAETYGPLGGSGYLPPGEASRQMRAAAERALELDPDLVEGLTALGACAAFHEWNWAEGEQLFRRALEVNSNYVTTYMWYGLLFQRTGRQVENLRARQRAFELSPLAVGAGAALGQALFLNGRTDEAIAVLNRTLELDPMSPQPLSTLGEIYVATNRYAEAIDAFARAQDYGGQGHAYAVAGRREEAEAVLASLNERARENYVAPHTFALVYVGLADTTTALNYLERGYAIRDTTMSNIKVDPRMRRLANEPRFIALLQKMGLTELP